MAVVSSIDESAELEDELLDRFGELPLAVSNLLAVSRLKVYGRTYGIDSITQRGDDVLLQFYEGQDKAVDTAGLAQIGNQFERRVQFEQGPAMAIRIKGKGLSDQQLLELLEQFLEAAQGPFNLKGELQNAVKK
ncbi:transcription-repair coupling factor [Actinobacillus pleuropneumoniae]|nr:transcription-repair coupling factor [Actinobacillus pleuropneumoniae]